jgi:hypothetical protein
MANVFTSTGTITNLTRLELEQLRRADSFTAGKALTVGDSAYGAENVVGKGDLNAEPYYTSPEIPLDSVYTNTPPTAPGIGLSTQTAVEGTPTDSVSWVGPELIYDSDVGWAETTTRWRDDTAGLNFTLFVQAGDLLLIKSKPSGVMSRNTWAVGTVLTVTANTLTLTNIYNPSWSTPSNLHAEADLYNYVIVRPSAAQLFAVPGSGPTGREQTFMMVQPGASVHSLLSPTVDQVNAVRLLNVVPANASGTTTIDRADGVYGAPAPRTSLDKLGYRVVLYPDNGSGTGPDLTRPIATLNPLINSTISADDQRMTIDYQAGIIRFSCAPRTGDDIKPSAGCVNTTTGRLNLYAVFWVIDTSLTKGNARGLWASRSTYYGAKAAGRIEFDASNNWWKIHSGISGKYFFVRALDAAETGETQVTEFGAYDVTGPRSFKYRSMSETWVFTRHSAIDADPATSVELGVADKIMLTMGDGANPAIIPGGDIQPSATSVTGGYRDVTYPLKSLVKTASYGAYNKVHLRRGNYQITRTIHVPPGVVIEGEGSATVLRNMTSNSPILRFGANTPWGVYDFDWDNTYHTPTSILPSTIMTKVEGFDICWNPNKRCWGFVWGDTTTQEVWFQEMTLAGTPLHAGQGIPLKNTATPLFTSETGASAPVARHTAGHAPRIAYDTFRNRYGVVWVETGLFNAPYVGITLFKVTDTDTVSTLYTTTLGSFTKSYDLPSIAFNDFDDGYTAYVSTAVKETGNPASIELHQVSESGVTTYDYALPAYYVITSTDVAINTEGLAMVVWSCLNHLLIEGTSGSITAGTPSTFHHNDTIDFTTLGVVAGDKFHHLNLTVGSDVEGGMDGYVCDAPSASTVSIKREDSPDKSWTAHAATNIRWAISPKGYIMSAYLGGSGLTPGLVIDSGTLAAGYFKAEMREPDFVRISAGSDGRYLVVFQAFNTTAYLSKTTLRNFDDGISFDFIDSGAIPVQSPYLYREHIGTCSVLMGATGGALEPSGSVTATRMEPDGSSLSNLLLCGNTGVAAKSLGAPDPLMPRPNSAWLNFQIATVNEPWGPRRGYHLDVSARNIVHKWTATRPMSLIPDVTWTGEDWTVISPTQNQIFSDTGYIILDGGDSYLVDETYFFGSGTKTYTDGNYLPQTASGTVYFPASGITATYTVISEHCVLLDTAMPAGKISYYAVYDHETYYDEARLNTGLKSMLFRVASDGSLIQGCSHLTPAMSHLGEEVFLTKPYIPDTRIETVSRRKVYTQYSPNVSSGGGNDPMTWGDLAQTGLINGGWYTNYPSTRISGDIGFVGAFVGAPRSYSYHTPTEAPLAALAWGESFFASMGRQYSPSQIALYRQSAGPYNSAAKSLRLENISKRRNELSITPTYMRMLSHTRILTRWGLPAIGTAGFDTDGYRNCFVYPSQKMMPETNPLLTVYYGNIYVGYTGRHAISWNATYTNATGEGPIEYMGPDSTWNSSNVMAFPPGTSVAPDTGSDPYPAARREYNSGAPIVIWNGSNFVAFWTEQMANCATDQQGNLICMGTYPGGEETHRIDDSIGTLNDMNRPTVNQVVRVSCGQGLDLNEIGDTTDPNRGQIATLGAAFSGKNYCVAWAVGLHPDTDTGSFQAGSTIGVTIFHGVTGSGGAQSYVLNTSTNGLYFSSPKVVWDGQAFVVFWRVGGDSGGAIRYQVVPEEGLGQSIQLRDLSAPTTQKFNRKHSIGRFHSMGMIQLGDASDISCGPGDLLHIQSTRTVTTTSGTGSTSGSVLTDGTANFVAAGIVAGDMVVIGGASRYTITNVAATQLTVEYSIGTLASIAYTVEHYVYQTKNAGWYTIRDYNPVQQTIHLALGIDCPWDGQEVIGAIFSGVGVGTNANTSIYKSDLSLPIPLTGISRAGQLLPSASQNEYSTTASDPARLLDVIYNEQDGTFAILYLDDNRFVGIQTVTRSDFRAFNRALITTSSVREGKISWNGHHYLVVYIQGTYIYYALLSRDFAVEESNVLLYHNGSTERHMCGLNYGQLPGPLSYNYVASGSQTWYDPAPANGCYQPRPWSLDLKWNDRLGRWILSTGHLWGLNNAASALGRDDIQQEYGLRTLLYFNGGTFNNPVTGYSGRTLTGKFYVPMIQPGMRLAFWDTANEKFAVVMTITGTGGSVTADPFGIAAYYTTLYVDVDSSQLTASDIAIVTHGHSLGEPYTTYIMTREDVYVTTLGVGNAAVEIIDGDSCSLEDMDIRGGQVDVSEVFNFMARPTWRSAGAMVGAPYDIANVYGSSLARHYTRSFLSPAGKVETVRLSNVRSQTPCKYGQGSDPADPLKGTQRGAFRNRRS